VWLVAGGTYLRPTNGRRAASGFAGCRSRVAKIGRGTYPLFSRVGVGGVSLHFFRYPGDNSLLALFTARTTAPDEVLGVLRHAPCACITMVRSRGSTRIP